MNLITILVALFIGLFVLVKLAERFSKPVSNEQYGKYSKWIIILLCIFLAFRVFEEFF
ncbi:hypothetical protein [Parendozoicomonas haliclonae]|uniref:Uncharacterized protein n=1 Tax=Parendozoicomonas haliclonae TaxID=1960125 RepID=A0A1X7APB3_9GAMM|nr:hypothetical protein [Parendozoicomonas haliclonae]SMA50144.1 hypothetical protein EHSB41UT_03935 [Parendozoicomonas haliclonae]